MRYTVLALTLTLIAFLTVPGQQDATAEKSPQESPPAKKADTTEKTKPPKKPLLLLDDDEEDSEPMADNSRCEVCHLDFAEEPIALTHAKADMGCTECHGDCDEHIADESWAVGGNGTAPGKLYYRKDINACCEKCHDEHDVPAAKVIAVWLKRHPTKPGAKPKKFVPKQIVCTDCHGDHKMHLKERKCKWKK